MGAIEDIEGHSRYFWGLRLHLLCTLHGLPADFALTGAKADELQILLSLLAADPALAAMLPGQILIGDKNYYGRDFEAALVGAGACLLSVILAPSSRRQRHHWRVVRKVAGQLPCGASSLGATACAHARAPARSGR
jgi:hypothetical protein